MVYVLINAENRIESLLEVNIGDVHLWDIAEDPGRRIIVKEQLELEDGYSWADYRYDEDTQEIVLDPQVSEIEYTDLETGEKTTMTSTEFEAMVDERVRNVVQATIREMAVDDATNLAVPLTQADGTTVYKTMKELA